MVAVLLLSSLACESSSTPTTPSGVLTVTSPASVLKAGDVETLQAASAGEPVTPTAWTSSDASVVSVTPAGVVTARRAGRATITASTGTASGQTTLRVVPDFDGTWTGPLFRAQVSCAPASTAAICRPGMPPDTSIAPATFVISQIGATATGTLVDSLEAPLVIELAGQVATDDTLAVEGASAASTSSERRLTVSNLRAVFDPSLGTITGSFTLTAAVQTSTGASVFDYTLQGQFRNLARR